MGSLMCVNTQAGSSGLWIGLNVVDCEMVFSSREANTKTCILGGRKMDYWKTHEAQEMVGMIYHFSRPFCIHSLTSSTCSYKISGREFPECYLCSSMNCSYAITIFFAKF